jgi:Zn-dependent M28 family amino/carboxypeptidase
LRSHARFLSSDLLEGRAAGSLGGRIAAHYIAAQFEALGLLPNEQSGDFFQRIALTGIKSEPTLTVGARQQTITLDPGTDFVAWPERVSIPITADGEIVFVGYGIHAPEWGWDDFGSAALTGKVLLVLAGEPRGPDSSAFRGDRMTRYATSRYKLAQAARVGATGVLLVHPDSVAVPWDAVRGEWSAERYFFDRPPESNLAFGAWISEETARRITSAADRDFDLLVRRAQLKSFQTISIGAHAVMRIRGSETRIEALNVLGRLQGRDPAVSDQHVVLLAHYDHLGIGEAFEGDSIYNGAEDNASGVASLLAAATGFAAGTERPRRSILFLATTAAEVGQLGAQAFVTNAPVPLEKIVAVVNVDRASVRGATRDVVGLGAEESGLGPYLQQVAAAERLTVVPDPVPAAGWFYRGDHLPFAMAGIPTLLLRAGTAMVEQPEGWGMREEHRYIAEHYHRPSDELRDSWDYDGMLQEVRLLIRLAWVIAETDEFPAWTDDSEFGAAAQRLRIRRMRQSGVQVERR